jgi:zinc transport system ATP-binding protein
VTATAPAAAADDSRRDPDPLPADEPLIEVDRVSFGYDRQPILEEVSLAVRRGDFLAILGPNGGGKTTLLKLILGLLEPWSGSVRRRLGRRRGALGYVPQFAGFDKNFPLRVADVVRTGRLGLRGPLRRWRAADDDAVAAALDRFGLAGQARHPVGELSGGQLQRTLIARAMVSEPELLFLDESLASVDAEYREVLVATLEQIQRRIPVVVVTHDLTPFAGAVRQIACVNRRLYYHPQGELTAEMLEEAYGCPVELVAHGVPHRVLADHGHHHPHPPHPPSPLRYPPPDRRDG